MINKMETRKITIISTKNNKRTVINTDATTLKDLKRALREADVDYDGMTFYEGLTKTELKLDDSLLPHDVQRINATTHEPETTNELVFMLTNTNKKIRSGVTAMTRAEAYAAIKENNLQAECHKMFGKNFTMCKTVDLIFFINNKLAAKSATPKVEAPKEETKVENMTTSAEPAVFVDIQVRAALKKLVNFLYQNDTIEDHDDVDEILSILDKDNTPASSQTDDSKLSSCSPYSDDELDAMFKDMPR